jgi:hypothetical protein
MMTSGFRFAPNAPQDQHHTSHHGQYNKKKQKKILGSIYRGFGHRQVYSGHT